MRRIGRGFLYIGVNIGADTPEIAVSVVAECSSAARRAERVENKEG